MSEAKRKGKLALVIEIDPAELACRIYEGMGRVLRPHGLTAQQGLEDIRRTAPDVHANLLRTAAKVAEYMTECFHNGQRPQ